MAGNTTMKDRNDRYYKLLERQFGPRPPCKLSGSSTDRKNGKCSACAFQIGEFEFDEVIVGLVCKGKIRPRGLCPFFIFGGLLAHTLDHGPEAQLTSQANERFAISQLENALRYIAGALNKLDRQEIDIHHADDPFYAKLMDIAKSEQLLIGAVTALRDRYKEPITRKGHPGKLDAQDITGCCLRAWEMLTGKGPGKNNARFLELLSAAWSAVYGEHRAEPSWPHYIDTLKQKAKKGRK
jgi:hypothetical protein